MEDPVAEESMLALGAGVPITPSRRNVQKSANHEDREKWTRMTRECRYLVGEKPSDVDGLPEAIHHYLESL